MGNRKWLAFLSCIMSTPLAVTMLDGVHAEPLSEAFMAGIVLGVFYLILRPVLRLLTFPIGCLTLGLSGFIIDCALVMALGYFVPGFHVDGFIWAALLAAIVDALCIVTGGTK
ncbi:MAG: phage holin family protein [Clostridia bacterium]|nr:phage holin family protein [Clostridia bacterium]